MAVKIRLQRKGRKKAPFYHIVVADARSPRDGRFIEKIGTYNPMTRPATIELDREKAFSWLMNGAQPTDTARAILRFKGVMYRKHLQRGVSKGAMTQEQADLMWDKWIADKESKIQARIDKTAEETRQFHKSVFGAAKKVAEPVAEAPAEEAEVEAAEEAEAPAEAPAEEPAVEAVAEEVPAEEAPEVEAAAEEAEAPAEEPAAEETPAEESAEEETKE